MIRQTPGTHTEKFRIAATALTVLFLCQCGTRIGNPPKPGEDDDEKEFARIPVPELETLANVSDDIQFSLTGISLNDNYNLQDNAQQQDKPADWPTGPGRYSKAVNTLGATIEAFNNLLVPVGSNFEIEMNSGTLKIRVDRISEPGLTHKGVICYNNEKFADASWHIDGSRVDYVRTTSFNPFVEDDIAATLGATLSASEITMSADQVKLTYYMSGELREKDPFFTKAASFKDYGYLEQDVATQVSVFNFVTDYAEPAGHNQIIDIRMAGESAPGGNAKVLAHHRGVPLLCSFTPFKEQNPAAPGWCLGAAVENNKGRVMWAAEFNNYWSKNYMRIGLPLSDRLKDVSFGPAPCPE